MANDRVLVVTGGFGAVGREVGRIAADRGWRVAALDVGPAPDDRAGLPPSAHLAGGVDLGNAAAAQAAVDGVAAHFGRLDALFNVAGAFAWQTVEEGDPNSWDKMFAINLKTALNASRAALPHLLRADGHGRIVNVGAAGAIQAGAGFGPYGAAKAAVHRLTEALAAETKGRGVTVNAVLPSTLDTPANRRQMADADFGKWVTPLELAEVMLFLASPAASGVTGALIPVIGRV